MKQATFVITVFLLLFFASCKKEKEPSYIQSDALKRSLNMNYGSYFIYYDSVAQQIDSFWMSSKSWSVVGSGYGYDPFEWATYRLKDSTGQEFTFATRGSSGTLEGRAYVGIKDKDKKKYWAYWTTLQDPFIEGRDSVTQNRQEQIVLNNVIYKDVFLVEGEKYIEGGNVFYKTAYSTESGLLYIKLLYNGKEVYNASLLRAHVVR